ncbi:MAG: endoglucanase [Oscillospiraceae bacterium]|nr:endoglucanase [Oscillospiraceae bacterium]
MNVINKIRCRRMLSLLCAIGITASVLQGSSAEAMISSTYFDTRDISVKIDATDVVRKISPYIYGINAESDISNLTVNAITQTDPNISSYNWENNYSNSGTGTASANGADLINSYPPGKWVEPALYTEYLITKAKRYEVPSRYVTLQMMGMVAADGAGDVYSSDVSGRWNNIFFNKADSYLSEPDINDTSVYIDEYVSYLVNRYGYAVDGGINGYFLDNEPENWAERFPSAVTEKITADGLIEKSALLASAVKRIDPTALVYGPSISGIEAFTSLKNQEDWEQHSREYSWFIDYYLMKMNEASRASGTRLLDVLDIHYHTEATNGLLQPVIGSNDAFSNNTRMQAPRILWDSSYTENSTIAILHTQHLPLIPTLEASINMYYPDTKLSFSEYNFGGGDHISGGIATADTLGIFAKFGVHMACLKPDTENIDYHKSAINLYTNYDGMGSSFGNSLVRSENGGDTMSSVYSAIDGNNASTLKTVLINKNAVQPKTAVIEITSEADYETAEVYCFNSEKSEITRMSEDLVIENNTVIFEMEPLTVYMFAFKDNDELEEMPINEEELIDEEFSEEPDENPVGSADEQPAESETSAVTEPKKPVETETEETLPPEHVSAETLSSVVTTVNAEEIPFPDDPLSGNEAAAAENPEAEPDEAEETGAAERKPAIDDDIKVPKGFKIVVCIMLGGVLIAMLYVIFAADRKSR